VLNRVTSAVDPLGLDCYETKDELICDDGGGGDGGGDGGDGGLGGDGTIGPGFGPGFIDASVSPWEAGGSLGWAQGMIGQNRFVSFASLLSFANSAGNDIFDALAGAPGTYYYTDLHGNLGWGFSPQLWASTWNFIDVFGPRSSTSGYQVYFSGGVASGFIPDLTRAIIQGLTEAGPLPGPLPADTITAAVQFQENTSLEIQLDYPDITAAEADHIAYGYMFAQFPEVLAFAEAYIAWNQVFGRPILTVFGSYPGVAVH
jgi:hypothetical protein